jgi:hypothetical protein
MYKNTDMTIEELFKCIKHYRKYRWRKKGIKNIQCGNQD